MIYAIRKFATRLIALGMLGFVVLNIATAVTPVKAEEVCVTNLLTAGSEISDTYPKLQGDYLYWNRGADLARYNMKTGEIQTLFAGTKGLLADVIGEYLVYVNRTDVHDEYSTELYLANYNTGKITRVTDDHFHSAPADHQNDYLVYVYQKRATYSRQIFLYNMKTGVSRPITEMLPDVAGSAPYPSPAGLWPYIDGNYVVWSISDGGDHELRPKIWTENSTV